MSEPASLTSATAPRPAGHNGWTIIVMAMGIGLLACCLLIPEADENRRLLFEHSKLKADLEHIQQQITINDEFLKRVGRDPALAERLAQRQMKFVRKGTSLLDGGQRSASPDDRSPWALVTLPDPPPAPPYQPAAGRLAHFCRDTRSRLYLLGGALMLLAAGIVLGGISRE